MRNSILWYIITYICEFYPFSVQRQPSWNLQFSILEFKFSEAIFNMSWWKDFYKKFTECSLLVEHSVFICRFWKTLGWLLGSCWNQKMQFFSRIEILLADHVVTFWNYIFSKIQSINIILKCFCYKRTSLHILRKNWSEKSRGSLWKCHLIENDQFNISADCATTCKICCSTSLSCRKWEWKVQYIHICVKRLSNFTNTVKKSTWYVCGLIVKIRMQNDLRKQSTEVYCAIFCTKPELQCHLVSSLSIKLHIFMFVMYDNSNIHIMERN